MNAQEFIAALEEKGVLSPRLLEKLREKVGDGAGTMPAKSLAKFLVQKKHISADIAEQLLQKPLQGESEQKPTLPQQPTATESVTEIESPPTEDLFADSATLEDHASAANHEQPVPKRSSRKKTRNRQSRRKPARRKNEWDSPLLLFGGGGLILLVLCGIVTWYLLFRDTGDDQLDLARTAMSDGSYSQAISHYERFLERFSGHPEQSPASVELAMARLRRATEGRSDYELAFDVANKQITAVQNEPSFDSAHDELATLLPRIASGLAGKAETEPDPAAAGELVELSNQALQFCVNPKLIPKKLRDDAELQEIRETLARVERRQESLVAAEATVETMQEAIDSGDTAAAYEAYKLLVKQHPERQTHKKLQEMVHQTSLAEQNDIAFIPTETPAKKTDPPSPIVAELALAQHRNRGEIQATGIICFHADGALYGLEVSTGALSWRRFTGFDPHPYVINIGEDVITRDASTNDLLRLDRATGKLQWRQPFDKPFAKPLLLGDKAFVASESGRLFIVELGTGTISGYLQFAQSLHVPPVADGAGHRLYLVGNHSSVYSISLDDLSCTGVYYLGHSPGSIRVAPVVALNKLAVFENRGVGSSQFHLLAIGENGGVTKSLNNNRLTGLVLTQPLVSGRRMIVLTDRGQMNAYELGPQQDASALSQVATRAPSSARSVIGFPLLTDRFVWVADSQLNKYAIQPTDNRLPVRDIAKNYRGAVFDHPLQARDGTLFHLRRPKGRAGIAAAAMDIATGRTLWETDLAIPPAGTPIVDPTNQTITTANTNGAVFVLDQQAIDQGVEDQPVKFVNTPPTSPPQLSSAIDLGAGRAVFGTAGETPWLVAYDPARTAARWVKMSGPLATSPARLGSGFVVPLEIGQVLYCDPAQNNREVAAFQPRLEPRQRVAWLPVGIPEDPTEQCVLCDGTEMIYQLQLTDGAQPTLEAVRSAPIGAMPLSTRIAVTGNHAWIGTNDRRLASFELSTLEISREITLSANIAWGPYAIANQLLMATSDNQLVCLTTDSEVKWKVPLHDGELAGPPLGTDRTLLLSLKKGTIQAMDLATGGLLGERDLGQPLATGLVPFGKRYLVAAHDGTLLEVEHP
jgi:outer membrane protein assembly factor BamB